MRFAIVKNNLSNKRGESRECIMGKIIRQNGRFNIHIEGNKVLKKIRREEKKVNWTILPRGSNS